MIDYVITQEMAQSLEEFYARIIQGPLNQVRHVLHGHGT